MCVVWGAHDRIIPSHHADIARQVAPGARVEVLSHSGHFPHRDHPERFVRILRDFVTQTAPATYRRGKWATILRRGAAAPALQAVETA
jgi:hypothetical protein